MAENTSPLSVFITGASSGTGRALTRELVRHGHKVTGTTTSSEGAFAIRADGGLPAFPDLSRAADVRGLLQMAKADVLVHLAASVLSDVPLSGGDYKAGEAALNATDELVIAAGQAGIKRLILVSPAFAYGDTGGEAVDESAPISHDHPLFTAVEHAETAVLDGGIPGYVVRSGYIYGSGSAGIRSIAESMRRGQGILSGKKPAAWIHEEDLASALAMLVERTTDEGLAQVYNAADDTPVSPDEFATEFGTVLGSGAPSHGGFFVNRRMTPMQKALLGTSFKLNSDRLKAAGWKPQFATRAAGLERTLMLWRAETAAEPVAPVLPERAIVTL
jgi:nucleoside-diphosphate-sugar epimerase